jgi:YCII-related domain
MKKFIVIYHAPAESWDPSNSTPEEREKSMADWMQWAEKCGEKLVDMGSPLMNGQQLNPDGTSKNSDNNVLGYSVLQAEDMEEAKGLLAGHPHLVWNATCSIEVHESMPMPGM